MATITVVTAFNPNNAGMYSVDLAAEQFLRSCGFSTRLVRTQAKKTWFRPRFGRQRFEVIRNVNQLFETDILVYWGDFTTNVLYGSYDFPIRDLAYGYNKTQETAFESWINLFLPDRPNHNTSVYSIGQNFLSLGQSLNSLPAEVRSNLESRYRQTFDAIIPRDDISLLSLNDLKLKESGVEISQGLDTAMLLNHYALYPKLKSVKPSNTFAYVFGRSGFRHVPELVKEIEQRSGFKGIELSFWHSLHASKADRQMQDMLEVIESAKFVLTDTYHCTINAITLGKPVFCLGVNQAEQIATVGEPKKRILFRMMGLLQNYLEFDDPVLVEDTREMIIDRIMSRMGEHTFDIKTISDLKSNFRDTVVNILITGRLR